jgi:putative tryptophan/tyrosine transport system substrate-binding protein
MDRRRFLLTPLAGAIAAPLVAEGQQAGKVHRIGVLSPEAPPPGILEGFREGLHELGYVEGKTITIELRHSGGLNDRLAAMAEELVRLRVDAILAINTPAAQAAKKATPSIPIVITRVADPVRTGLVPSLSRPGGNITGLSFQPEELSGKRIELLKETLPGVSRVAALWYMGNPGATIVAKGLESSGVQLGIQILRLPVQSLNDYVGAFETAARGRAGALILVDDAFVTRHRSQILELAAKHSMPVFSLFMPFVEGGGLMAYGPNVRDMYRRAAHYVDKILKGARPADLPIEQPSKFELVINLKKARAMGLTIPPSLLARADQVIE